MKRDIEGLMAGDSGLPTWTLDWDLDSVLLIF